MSGASDVEAWWENRHHSVADIVARMTNNFEAQCAELGHFWAAHSDGLSFKTSGSGRWKGTVKVSLDEGKDLYILKFMRVCKMQMIVDKIIEDVFVEDLVRFIDEQVG